MATQPSAARLRSHWGEIGKRWGEAWGLGRAGGLSISEPGSSQTLQLVVRLPPPTPVLS